MVSTSEDEAGGGTAVLTKPTPKKKTPTKKKWVNIEDLPVVEEWISAGDAADIAGVSRQYMHAVAYPDGKTPEPGGPPGLPARRIGTFLMFRPAQVKEWAANRLVELERAEAQRKARK